MAEDRDLFNEMMEKLEIPMPESGMAVTIDDAFRNCSKNRVSINGKTFICIRWTWNGSCLMMNH